MNRYEPFYLPLFPLSLFFTSILQLHFCSTHSYQFSPRKEIARSFLRINSFQQITLTLIRILNCIPLKTFNFKRCWNHHRNGDTLFPFGSLFWLVLASLASSEAIILDQCFSTSAYNFARKGRKRGREETKTRVGEEREKKGSHPWHCWNYIYRIQKRETGYLPRVHNQISARRFDTRRETGNRIIARRPKNAK